MGLVSEYIVNPRRAPRAPSRCSTLVHAPDADWKSETEDFSPLGCQLVAPVAMARGLPLTLVFASPRVKGSLQVEGKVAWGSSQPPWRVGISFGEASRAQSERWFAALLAAHPGLAGLRRVPDRLPVDAMLFLGAPPTFLVDFTPDEVEVLRHVASGTSIAALRSRLEAVWAASQRAIFSLLARSVLTVSRSSSVHTSAWSQVMEELKVDFVVEAARPTRSSPFLEAVAPAPAKGYARFDGPIDLDIDPRLTSPLEPPPLPAPAARAPTGRAPAASAMAPRSIAPAAPRPAAPVAPSTPPSPGSSRAGTGWRGTAAARSPQAQECLDNGRMELAAGNSHSALAHLRRALQLSPGDSEIAGEIGRALKRG
jgi:hypothetical protein